MPDRDATSDHLRETARTRLRARRRHQGTSHWHVEVRSTVIICRACGARVPKSLEPQCCPECGAGG